MDKLLIWASRAVALLPGVAVLATGIGSPPGYEKIFGGLIEAFGAVCLLVIELNRGRLRKSRRVSVTNAALVAAITSFLLFVAYIPLVDYCVVRIPGRTPVYFPLIACRNLQSEISEAGSRAALVNKWGSAEVDEIVRECPEICRIGTTVVLLLFYASALLMLTIALGVAAAAIHPETAT